MIKTNDPAGLKQVGVTIEELRYPTSVYILDLL
jgi:hypothetical protein